MSQKQSQPAEAGRGASKSLPHLAAVFAALPDAVIVSDRAGKIVAMNAAAFELFEVQPENSWLGMSLREFFQRYEWLDESHRPTLFAPWLLDLITRNKETSSCSYKQILLFHLPAQHPAFLEFHGSPVLDTRMRVVGLILVFHPIASRYQKALHLQRVYEAVLTLNEAIAQIPEHLASGAPDEAFLLSRPVLCIAQQLTEVIHQVLKCWHVSLLGRGSEEDRVTYVAGSGFTARQEQQRRAICEHFLTVDIMGESVIASLRANQEVMLRTDQLHLPAGYPVDFGKATLLILPLFLEQFLAGALIIAKKGWNNRFLPEEVELAKAVAAQAILIVECLGSLQSQADKQARDLVHHEIQRLGRDFLTLASHELRTPLTSIKGNLQLAQRRLGVLKRQLAEQSENVHAHIEHARQSLEQAEQSTRVQERMVQDMIDDARIQANQLTLSLKPCDLLPLLRASIARLQESTPERAIELEILTPDATIPVLADAGRIAQVFAIYLTNALDYSPPKQPVRVQVREEDNMVRVSVHDEGPGIPLEEQERLWDRFYRGKGSAVQHELDLSLGLSFYLCQALIERHRGSVGVESTPGHGTTFWFILPLTRTTTAEFTPDSGA